LEVRYLYPRVSCFLPLYVGSSAVSNAFSNADPNEPEPIPELKPLDKGI